MMCPLDKCDRMDETINTGGTKLICSVYTEGRNEDQ